MKQYIDKDALVAEIERRIKVLNEKLIKHPISSPTLEKLIEENKKVLSLIDTLDVKEVDLEKEIQQHINDCLDIKFPTTDIKTIAKDVEYTAHKFFELGLKAKGE